MVESRQRMSTKPPNLKYEFSNTKSAKNIERLEKGITISAMYETEVGAKGKPEK